MRESRGSRRVRLFQSIVIGLRKCCAEYWWCMLLIVVDTTAQRKAIPIFCVSCPVRAEHEDIVDGGEKSLAEKSGVFATARINWESWCVQ